jgi:hypothetical protein
MCYLTEYLSVLNVCEGRLRMKYPVMVKEFK